MPDDALRELERRWRSSNALDDGVAWHRARLRAETVTLDDLRREAAEGDLAAWKVLDPHPLVVRLDAWLREHAPERLAGFNPPATEAALAETEAALGRPLPPVLRALYLWRDGQPRGPWTGVGDGPEEEAAQVGFDLDPPQADVAHLDTFPRAWRLLSLRELRGAAAWVSGPESAWPADALPFMIRRVRGKPMWFHELRALDPSGPAGDRVVEGYADWPGGAQQVTAPSLERWLEVVLAALERSVWEADDPDPYRLEYFERAVNPGYPLRLHEDRTIPTEPPLIPREGAVRLGFTECLPCMSILVMLVAMPATFALRSERPTKTDTVVASLVALAIAALIAFLFPWWVTRNQRRAHERFTAEFADATLDTPVEDDA